MSIFALWLPILVSAVVVFVASSVVWILMPWHKSDFNKTRDEKDVRAALSGLSPGYYMVPYAMDQAEFKKPEVQQKWIDGPLAYVTVIPNGLPQMGPKFVMSFIFYVLVGTVCAYLVTRTIGTDASYLTHFRIAGTTAFVAYGVAYIQDAIWFGRPWSVTAKYLLDALIYGCLTGGVFGWLAA